MLATISTRPSLGIALKKYGARFRVPTARTQHVGRSATRAVACRVEPLLTLVALATRPVAAFFRAVGTPVAPLPAPPQLANALSTRVIATTTLVARSVAAAVDAACPERKVVLLTLAAKLARKESLGVAAITVAAKLSRFIVQQSAVAMTTAVCIATAQPLQRVKGNVNPKSRIVRSVASTVCHSPIVLDGNLESNPSKREPRSSKR